MKLEGRRKSENIVDLTSPEGWIIQLLEDIKTRFSQAAPTSPDKFSTNARGRDYAERYYQMKTGKNPSEQFFNWMFSAEYVPSGNPISVGEFLMSHNSLPSTWLTLDPSRSTISYAAPPGGQTMLTPEELRIATHTGPQFRKLSSRWRNPQ